MKRKCDVNNFLILLFKIKFKKWQTDYFQHFESNFFYVFLENKKIWKFEYFFSKKYEFWGSITLLHNDLLGQNIMT